MAKILVIGSSGQLGTELTQALRDRYGTDNVIASDKRINNDDEGTFVQLDVLEMDELHRVVNRHDITQIYHLAAMLSATGEKYPQSAWDLNMQSLINVLELAKEKNLDKIYWPSSIAVFGPSTPKQMTPQRTIMEPTTVYGISKLAGERWCEYYHQRYGVDVRSLRYPGLIGYKGLPGGGTTDYAVDIYHKAITDNSFECFLKKDTYLPMMYMPDAIKATVELMESDEQNLTVRSSYNISALTFSPEEIYKSVTNFISDFSITYQPDFREKIADSWPNSLDDTQAKEDWGWEPAYSLDEMTEDILVHLRRTYEKAAISS
jgi:nucleoside-diphosphate-sugar epimerase